MKTVWITRTETQKPVELSAGWGALRIPLLSVAPASKPPEPPLPDDVLVFTSSNAVDWFCNFTQKRDWPVYTVGDTTAAQAVKAGFQSVTSAKKDVAALTAMIIRNSDLKSKRLYYGSGQDISTSLPADLQKQGYFMVRQIFYETHPITRTPPEIKAALTKERTLTVLLYSSKGAHVFRDLDLDMRRISTVSISDNVDSVLKNLNLKSRKTAHRPTHKALIKQLN